MSRYEPEFIVQPDGTVVELYGAVHAARQEDARAALDQVRWSARLVVTTLHCGAHAGRRNTRQPQAWPLLGRVYKTFGDAYVVALEQRPRIPRELVDLMHDRRDLRDQHTLLLDPLEAPDDRDLECSGCRCGPKLVSRSELRAAVRNGDRKFLVS